MSRLLCSFFWLATACAFFVADASAQVTFYAISDPSLIGSVGSTTADPAETNGLIGDEPGETAFSLNSTGSTRLTFSQGNLGAVNAFNTGPATLHFPSMLASDPAVDASTHGDFSYRTTDLDAGAMTFEDDGGSFVFAGDGTFSYAFTELSCSLGGASPETCDVGLEMDLVGHGYLVGPADDPATVPGLATDPAGDLVSYVQTLRGFAPAGSTVGLLLVSMDLTAENIRGSWLALFPSLVGGTVIQAVPVYVPPASIDIEGEVDPTIGPGDTNRRGETVWIGRTEWARASVLGGAYLLSEGLVAGEEAGVDGQIDVRGVDSLVEVGQLVVGLTGSGRMNITDGAVVDVDFDLDRCPDGGACSLTNTFVAAASGSDGFLTISGAGSTLRAFNAAAIDSAFMIGFNLAIGTVGVPGGDSVAEVLVEDQGLLETQGAIIGNAPGTPGGDGTETSLATLTVRGEGSLWNARANLVWKPGVGYQGADILIGGGSSGGLVEILDGADLIVGDPTDTFPRIRLAGGEQGVGVLRVSGEGSSVIFEGTDAQFRTDLGTSLLEVREGGSFEGGYFFAVGGGTRGTHRALVTGDGSVLKVSGTCQACGLSLPAVVAVGWGASGSLEVREGGLVEVDPLGPPATAQLGGVFVGGGQITNASGGGTGAMVVEGTNSRLRILGEAMRLVVGQDGIGTVQIEAGGQITLENPDGEAAVIVSDTPGGFGALVVAGDASLLDAGETLQLGGAPGAAVGGTASAIVDEGGILRAIATHVGAGGLLAGNGTVEGDVSVGLGRMAPGTSAGALHITGNLSVASSGTLTLEVEGSVDYDTIDVDGVATVDGVVDLEFGEFVPTEGDRFELVRSGTPVDFAEATIRISGPSHPQFSIDSGDDGNAMRVTYVPEPEVALQAVFVLATLGVLTARRRSALP